MWLGMRNTEMCDELRAGNTVNQLIHVGKDGKTM
jgi:hypothetical protein